MILDVDYGLYIGLVLSLLLFIVHSQRTLTSIMGNLPHTDIYEAIESCEDAREIVGIRIVRFEQSIFYANVDNFVYKIVKKCGVDPAEVLEKIRKIKSANANLEKKKLKETKNQQNRKNSGVSTVTIVVESTASESVASTHELTLEEKIENILEEVKIKDLIIDFSCVNYIDSMGIDALIKLTDMYRQIRVQLHLTHCKSKKIFDSKFDFFFS